MPGSAAQAATSYQESMSQAQAAASRNDWNAFEKALKTAVQLSSATPARQATAMFALGNLYRDRQNPALAYNYYQSAYAKSPVQELKSLALLKMAQCQFACRQYNSAKQLLNMLASNNSNTIREEARQTSAVVEYWGGSRRAAEKLIAGYQASSIRDFAENSSYASVSALIWLRLFEDEKRRSGASSKEASEFAYQAALSLAKESKLNAQSLLAVIMGNVDRTNAQSKLKQAQLTETARYHSNQSDAKLIEALRLSLEHYGPEHKKTKELFEWNVHKMDSFESSKEMADMMINACTKAYGENDLRTIKAEESLGRLYIENKEDQYGYDIYQKCLSKLNKTGNNSGEAQDLRCGLNGLIGSRYAYDKDYVQAEPYLKAAAEAAREHTNYSFRIIIMQSYICTIKALGKTDRLAWAEAQLKEAESDIPVIHPAGF